MRTNWKVKGKNKGKQDSGNYNDLVCEWGQCYTCQIKPNITSHYINDTIQNVHCPPESLLAPSSHFIITLYIPLLHCYLYYTAVTSLFSRALPLVSLLQCSPLIRKQSQQKPSWATAIQQLSSLPWWHCRPPFILSFLPHCPTGWKKSLLCNPVLGN